MRRCLQIGTVEGRLPTAIADRFLVVRLLLLGVVGVMLASCGTADQPAIDQGLIAEHDRGVALMGRYEYAAAEEVFAAVAARNPGWLEARVNLAIATLNRQQEGDEQLALDILATVLAEDQAHLRALYTTAILHLYLGDAERAAGQLERVTQADPNDAYAAYFLGQALLQQGDYQAAADWMLKSAALDPYLRSAYWAGSQALRRAGRAEEAGQLLADYQRFDANPAARLAGFSYTRMGPKATALAVTPVQFETPPVPAGALFASPRQLVAVAAGGDITTADFNGDGHQDLLVAGETALLLAGDGETFTPVDDHPLAGIAPVNAALWGDVDDDGLLDAVLCGATGARIWRQTSADVWAPAATLGDRPCHAGALFDADHDGDLDVFSAGTDGNELYSNNRDGSFRKLADDFGLRGGNGMQVLIADLDGDRDLDIVVLNRTAPHDVWQNDRTWLYQPLAGLDDFKAATLSAATIADVDADGYREIYGLTPAGELLRWRYDGSAWLRDAVVEPSGAAGDAGAARALAVADFNGDGRQEILRILASGFAIIDPASAVTLFEQPLDALADALPVVQNAAAGPAVVALGESGLTLSPPGAGRYPFLALAPSGRSEGEQMRSNASGIGTAVKVRAAGRWTVLDALDSHSGPGQSLQPLSAGLGGHHQADFVALEWSDGVRQTELDLAAGERHAIAETERQLASCPVFFVWDGSKFRFVSDVLGGGALGYLSAPGSYAPPRPVEGYLLDSTQMAPREGRYRVKFAEPMEENAYLDAARLTLYDLPEDWSMVLDERLAVGGAPATGRPIYFRRAQLPASVVAADGTDVTTLATALDRRAPPLAATDPRFIGLLAEDQALTLSFNAPLPTEGAVLVADGWIEFPYSQTVFAAWQAGLRYRAPTLEARGADGLWQPIAVEFGYPAGMPRTMALPLPALPPGTDALRLSSNMEIYWDRLRVAWEEPLDAAEQTLAPSLARVARTGFAKRTTGPQRQPHYDYHDRSTFWDAKVARGFYTALGDAVELVRNIDGALAIIGSGEEIHLEFPAQPAPAPGHRRYYALRFHGWAKDMDLYTQHGDTVGPLPAPAGADAALLAKRDQLHVRYNVRFQAGH